MQYSIAGDLHEEYGNQVERTKILHAFQVVFGPKSGVKICEFFDYNIKQMYNNDIDFVKEFGKKNHTKLQAIDLIYRYKGIQTYKNVEVRNSNDAYNAVKPYYRDWSKEYFYLLSISRGNVVIKIDRIAIGGLSGVVVDMKIIANTLIRNGASSCILVHNHPSGKLLPSDQDKQITSKAKKAMEVLDIKVLDHLIVTESSYFSFADEGILR